MNDCRLGCVLLDIDFVVHFVVEDRMDRVLFLYIEPAEKIDLFLEENEPD